MRGRLEVRELTVTYGEVVALRGASFTVGPGQILGVVGPNGAGKSTLLKAVLELIPADAGSFTLDGRPLAEQRRRVAYLPQRAEVDWDYPAVVEEVVMMGRYPLLGWLRRPGPADRERVAEALERVAMTPYAATHIGELSGGQQQRVFLARAMAQGADLLLLDEPFAGVDALTEQLLWREIEALRDAGATVLIVNHDLATVSRHFDRLLLLARRVVAYGPVGEVFTRQHIAEAYGGVPEMLTTEGLA